jgi:hypothetical protein
MSNLPNDFEQKSRSNTDASSSSECSKPAETEQRKHARDIYESNIRRSSVHSSEADWKSVCDRWGEAIEWESGGRHEIALRAEGEFSVTRLGDRQIVSTGSTIRGRKMELGRLALLTIDRVSIVASSKRMQYYDPVGPSSHALPSGRSP